MLIAALQAFLGANQRKNKRLLPDLIGTDNANLDPRRADMAGFPGLGETSLATFSGGQAVSLYRWGRDNQSETNYWVGSTDVLDFARSMLAEDAKERTYVTGGSSPPRYFDADGMGSPPYPTAWTALGVPAPSGTMVLTLGTAGSGTTETRIYLDTFVRANGDESAPNSSVPSIAVKGGSTVNLSSLASVPGGTHGITMRRIYVSTGGVFQRIKEQAAALTTAVDDGVTRGLTLTSGGRDDVDPGSAWLEPPTGLIGLTPLWNGMMLGGVGKCIRICYPYKPHAWPLKWEFAMTDTFVGAATWGQSVVVVTTGYPRVASGTAPGSMNPVPIFLNRAAGVSKRSIRGVGHGVCWASNVGLCYHGQMGSRIITEDLLTDAQWQALNPSTMIGACWGRYYIGFYSATQAFMIDTLDQSAGIYWLNIGAKGIFEDTISGNLFVITSANQVKKWAAGSALTASFTSREFRQRIPVNPRFAKVIASTYPVDFSLYADGVLKHTQSVTSEEPITLPGDYEAQYFKMVLSGVGPVEGCALSTDQETLP